MGPQKEIETFDILEFRDGIFIPSSTRIIREVSLSLILNGRKITSIAYSGSHGEELALGYLKSEGIIESLEDVENITHSEEHSEVHVWTKKGEDRTDTHRGVENKGGPEDTHDVRDDHPAATASPLLEQRLVVSPSWIITLMKEFIDSSSLHSITGGTHSAALAYEGGLIVVREDIGRHNTIDMVGGYILLKGIDCSDKILLRTGRVSSEIIHKVRKLGIPIVVSLSVPTSMAIRLSIDSGITMIRSMRDGGMVVYSHHWRVRNLL